MTKLARTITFDESDSLIFARAAEAGEWAIPGGFEFSDWTEAELTGKAKQAFSNGWLSVESFGRCSLVAVAAIDPAEVEAVTRALAAHFVAYYGAPDIDAAMAVAREEISFMADLCADHDPNTLLAVSRELTPSGVRESFSAIQPHGADIAQFAVHGSLDDPHDGSKS